MDRAEKSPCETGGGYRLGGPGGAGGGQQEEAGEEKVPCPQHLPVWPVRPPPGINTPVPPTLSSHPVNIYLVDNGITMRMSGAAAASLEHRRSSRPAGKETPPFMNICCAPPRALHRALQARLCGGDKETQKPAVHNIYLPSRGVRSLINAKFKNYNHNSY